ncbi:hypothetical protein DICVIV_01884 [Dictyocaulus viviparus]|uniref:Uncharacterized protein n=1 Tax=Dictyocaulus viviparus TaxID=29172 RepID=A0A0D8Y4W5_DICVI|nr:hypothetical protein DICVIV_01884 [Dictyocaulus viviparus]
MQQHGSTTFPLARNFAFGQVACEESNHCSNRNWPFNDRLRKRPSQTSRGRCARKLTTRIHKRLANVSVSKLSGSGSGWLLFGVSSPALI